MDDPVTAHHAWGYLWLVLGGCLVLLTPHVFIALVNRVFEQEEDRQRLDYALTPEFLRKPWYFALKNKFWKALVIYGYVVFAVWWLGVVAMLIFIGVSMISGTP